MSAWRAQTRYGRSTFLFPICSSRRSTSQAFQTSFTSSTVFGSRFLFAFASGTPFVGACGWARTTSSNVAMAALPTLPPDAFTYSRNASR